MDIERIGVVGAGQMGTGIAQVAAQAGLPVRLLDIDSSLAETARKRIDNALSAQVKKGKLEDDVRLATISRIHPAKKFDEFTDVHLVIEAAIEDTRIKCEIFRQVEAVTPPEVILASN